MKDDQGKDKQKLKELQDELDSAKHDKSILEQKDKEN